MSLLSAIVLSTGATSLANVDEQPVHLHQYTDAAGETFSAISVKPANLTSAKVNRHVIIVDTSASQVGTVREASLKMVQQVLAEMPATAQIRLMSVDTECIEYTKGFVGARSAQAGKAVGELRQTTPLGATRLQTALQTVSQIADGQPMSVLYIGDGITSRETLSMELAGRLASVMASKQVCFHSVVLGPTTDNTLPGIFASLTGGTVADVDSSDVKLMASALQSAAVKAELQANGKPLPTAHKAIWLRPGQGTMAYLNGATENLQSVSVKTEDGSEINFTTDDIQTLEAPALLKSLVRDAVASEGLMTPICSRSAFTAASESYEHAIEKTLKVADYLKKQGRSREARHYLQSAADSDEKNVKIKYLLAGMTQQDGTGVLPPDDELPSGAVPADPLGDVKARIDLQTQVLKQNTDAAIDDAAEISFDQPDAAISILKDMLETIRSERDVSPDVKLELATRVSNVLADVRNKRESNELKQRQIAVQDGVRVAIEAMQAEEVAEEEKLANLIEQVRGLLEQGRHGDANAYEDAEGVSRLALEIRPGNGPATQALVMSEALGQLDKAYRLVQLRHDRFLETLYQVELSHVPFPDEPPVQYPPADVWRALTLTRVPKYESVDLRIEAPIESWMRKLLDEEVPPLDFPGEVSLKEILDTLKSHFDTTSGAGAGPSGNDYRMTIVPDKVELDLEGIGSLDDVLISDISFEGMTLKSALKLIFDQTIDPELTYIIEDEVFKVTTLAKAESTLVTRVYPVADLIVIIPPPGALGGGGGFGGGGGLGGGGLGGGGLGGGGLGGGGLGGGGLGGGGLGGGFMSIPDDLLDQMADDAANGISDDAINGLKKKPMN